MYSFGGTFAKAQPYTLLSRSKAENLYILAQSIAQSPNVPGVFYECGVYKGGSALVIGEAMRGTHRFMHLFDTFTGIANSNPQFDNHHKDGDFSDTSVKAVSDLLWDIPVQFHEGKIPDTFNVLDVPIAFAHIDVDVYQAHLDCLAFIWPRMSEGGIIVFDDYNQDTCLGAKLAVDTFFPQGTVIPIDGPQAYVVK